MRKASAAFYRGVKSGQEEYAERIRELEARVAELEADNRQLRVYSDQLESGGRDAAKARLRKKGGGRDSDGEEHGASGDANTPGSRRVGDRERLSGSVGGSAAANPAARHGLGICGFDHSDEPVERARSSAANPAAVRRRDECVQNAYWQGFLDGVHADLDEYEPVERECGT